MRSRGPSNWLVRVSQLVVFIGAAGTAFADAAQTWSPTNIFAPASTPAKSIFGLSLFILAVTGAIFLVVFSLLLYSVVRFRKRKNDDGREPPQVYGSNQVELAWTIIPILIVVALFMATARVIAVVQKTSPPGSCPLGTGIPPPPVHQWNTAMYRRQRSQSARCGSTAQGLE